VSDKELDQTLSTEPTPDAVALSTSEGVDPDSMPAGTIIGSYVVRRTIASGGGGTVFAAEHRSRGERVAIKVLRAEVARSPQGLARFQREARVVSLVRHPAIVDIRECGQLPDGRPFFVMELLEGADLKQLIKSRGRFSVEETYEVVFAICAALDAAHSAGVIHRDLKASNVHVAVKDGHFQVKLLDFGIAKLLLPDLETLGLTASGVRLGTASAMAPEQIRGEPVDQRTDVYALGVLIYQLLTGRLPFRADTRHEIERMNLEVPPPRPSQLVGVTATIDAVVLRCMDKRAERRYDSAGAVARALREAVDGAATGAEALARKPAVAVYVDIRPAQELDEADEDLLDEMAEMLELAEQSLLQGGLAVPLHTGTTLLAACVLPDDPLAALVTRKAVIDQAVALAHQLAARVAETARLDVRIRVHADMAVVRGSAASPTPEIAGPIVDVATWPVGLDWKGVEASGASVADLESDRTVIATTMT
jgi:predicted Ser/Thr protein kinase